MKEVYAVWEVEEFPKELGEIHVSCGVEEPFDQWSGYLPCDKGARIVITPMGSAGWRIEFTAPSRGLEQVKDHWLSPNQIDDGNAKAWGIRRRR